MSSVLDEMPPSRGFAIIDYVIFATVVLISLAIGLYHAFTGDKQRTTGEYLMGNRNLKTIPVAMSILVSYVSSILVLGVPAEMYTRGTQLVLRTVGYCFACVISSLLFVPLFYRLNVTSSFEYLERRFNSRVVKLLGTFMMLIGNVFYMGLVMYSPSTALQAATGFPLVGSIIITGLVSTLYTTLGCIKVGGIEKVWQISSQGGRIDFFNFDPDPTQRLTFWSTVVGGMFHTFIAFGVGQTSVQRYCSLPTLKQAKRSVFLNIPGLLLVNILACLVGLVVFAYYSSIKCDPLEMGYISNSNQLVPYFVTDVLNYPGLPGVFLAVLFSGALSSMSSSLNAAAAVTWEDLLKGCYKHLKEARKAIILKTLVVCYGGVAVIIAFLAEGLGGHVLWASISFTGATSGPSLGMFLLGALFPCANAKGAISGFVVSTVFNLWVAIGAYIYRPYPISLPTTTDCCNVTESQCYNMSLYDSGGDNYSIKSMLLSTTEVTPTGQDGLTGVYRLYGLSFLWYSAVGAGITVFVGLVVSMLTGPQKPEELDDSLVSPIFERMCCCLPERWRHKLRCGVTRHKTEVCDKVGDPVDIKVDDGFSSRTPLTESVGEHPVESESEHRLSETNAGQRTTESESEHALTDTNRNQQTMEAMSERILSDKYPSVDVSCSSEHTGTNGTATSVRL